MNKSFSPYGIRHGGLLRTIASNTTAAFVLGGLYMLGSAGPLNAQGLLVDAQINGQTAGGGLYDYTITLNNEAGSASSLETFWYSWVPGANFLPSNPTTISAPSGWAAAVTHVSAGDGYGIQFTTSTSPLNPGSSLEFGFSSSDTPTAIAGDSPFYPGTPVGTSFVYSGGPFAGSSQQFVVQSVPEPMSLTLAEMGFVGLVLVDWRRKHRGNPGKSNHEGSVNLDANGKEIDSREALQHALF